MKDSEVMRIFTTMPGEGEQSPGAVTYSDCLCGVFEAAINAGLHSLDTYLRQLGYELNSRELKIAYRRFVAMADQKEHVTDADLIYILETSMETPVAV